MYGNKNAFLKIYSVPRLLAVLFFCVFTLSCRQDSIFFAISNEPEPKGIRFPATPPNIVVADGPAGENPRVYAVTRWGKTIQAYTPDSDSWSTIPAPGGHIGEIASDGTALFALVFPNGEPLESSVIKRYDPNAYSWTDIYSSSAEGYSIQTLYGANGQIFAGALMPRKRPGSTAGWEFSYFAILHYDGSTVRNICNDTAILYGAAWDGADYYLATRGSGIYEYTGSGNAAATPIKGVITGIIAAGGKIIAVGNNGNDDDDGGVIYSDVAASSSFSGPHGVRFTGGMGVWSGGGNELLLLGIRREGVSYEQGYRETNISASDGIRLPGAASTTSIQDQNKYEGGLGTHPVHAILQVPPEVYNGTNTYPPGVVPLIFAATSKDGLWSYRDGQWNTEE